MEYFGTLSREWALECMKDLLLVNLRGNLQIIVQVRIFLFFIIKTFYFVFVLSLSLFVVLGPSSLQNRLLFLLVVN